jgi:mycothiol synthase
MTGWSITAGRVTPAQTAGVLALADAAQAVDGVAPLSEHVLLHLRHDGTEDRDLVLTVDKNWGGSGGTRGAWSPAGAGDQVAGYAHLDTTSSATGAELSGELAIHPDHRREGLGLALVRTLTAQADGHPVRLWAHGDLPAAARLAWAAGFKRFRALWQMRRALGDPLDQPRLPPGTALRTFRPGQDEDEWLSLNLRAFAEHPEQGAWTRHDLELREREPWFDPAGFFIAERHGAMAGFHWTKVHGPEDAPAGIGEVYVVGVDPGEQGTGLGRALTLAGLHHLRDRGLAQVMLYVDEDNAPAIRLYESLGFARWRTDAMYRHAGDTSANPRTPAG